MKQNSFLKNLLLKVAGRMPKNATGDRLAALIIFLVHQKRFPNFKKGGLNDAIYFIKTSDEILRPERTFNSDKELVKIYVSGRVGNQHNVPTLAVLHSIDEVQNYRFEPGSVLKPTHMSGEVIFFNGDKDLDIERIRKWFSVNYYNWTRERNYRLLTPKIIVEPLIFSGEQCDDYKIFCVNGEPKFILFATDRKNNLQEAVFTTDWRRVSANFVTKRVKPIPYEVDKPKNLDELLVVARELSRDFNFIRVDCYTDGETIYVGELTNTPGDTRSVFGSRAEEEAIANILFSKGGIDKELTGRPL